MLTLSATPIPRTLQLALTGVRELSLITTPPIDRLAVRTFISPFDGLVVREALLRERYRGGQSFYVCPRISDLAEQRAFLAEAVPEVKVAVAHGQMAASELEDIMTAFYDGAYDVLLSTSIVESGLDIPTANTLIVHRADMFGLAQLYQLRGRVGRSKARAYALFTMPADEGAHRHGRAAAEGAAVARHARRRLPAREPRPRHPRRRQSPRRGAVGPYQEVGYELYQQMLEEAVAALKAGGEAREAGQLVAADHHRHGGDDPRDLRAPTCSSASASTAALPISRTSATIEAFAAELIDRFGPLPEEVQHLLEVVAIKALCREANVEKVDVGPKGAVDRLPRQRFANPAGLVRWITERRLARQGPPRPEGRRHPRLGGHRRSA